MIDARELDSKDVPTAIDFKPTDLVLVFRQGSILVVSGETFKGRTRPHLLSISSDYSLYPEDPGLKIDPRGQHVTITLPPIRSEGVAGNEYAIANVADPDLPDGQRGSIDFVPAPGEFIHVPRQGKLPKLTIAEPSDTFGLRAEVIPLAGYTPGDPPTVENTRVCWLITRS